MAITSTSQILSTSKVATATSFLDDAINYLQDALENLETAKSYASYDNFHTDQGYIFPDNTAKLIEYINELIRSISELKADVNAKAQSINQNEWAEYNAYLEKKKEEEQSSDSSSEVVRV